MVYRVEVTNEHALSQEEYCCFSCFTIETQSIDSQIITRLVSCTGITIILYPGSLKSLSNPVLGVILGTLAFCRRRLNQVPPQSGMYSLGNSATALACPI